MSSESAKRLLVKRLNQHNLIMKKFILTAILFAFVTGASAKDPVIKDTTINKIEYKLYQGSRGGRYVIVISKTGKPYRKYFKG
jgi:hypothetical protein